MIWWSSIVPNTKFPNSGVGARLHRLTVAMPTVHNIANHINTHTHLPQAELEGTKPPLDDHLDDDDEDSNSATPQSSRPPSTKPEENNEGGLKQFPDGSGLNSRLRRLVTSYQREYKKEEARQQAKDKRNERRERIEQVIREREKQKTEQQQRKWSRREEQNFLRTIMAYGVEYSSKEARFVWDR